MENNIIQKVEVKDLNFAEVPNKYAKFLSCGFDSIQESFDVTIRFEFAEILFVLRDQAERTNSKISLPEHIFKSDLQMMPIGASGFTYRLENDRFQVLIRNPAGQQRDWQVSVRYLSSALWLYGYEKIKAEVLEFISKTCDKPNSDEWQHVTRADYCFDFYSKDFDDEMTPNILSAIVATSRAKQFINTKIDLAAVARAGKIETLTIGSKKSLQVSIYDKTKEITEASGKNFFYDIWGEKYNSCVYRVEVRMSKEWLKDRNVRSMAQLQENLAEILNDALRFRRLAIPSNDSNRSRWAIHPLWVMCFDAIANPSEIVKIGRYVSQRKEFMENTLFASAKGVIRSLVVLKANDWDDNIAVVAVKDIFNGILDDPIRNKRVMETKEKYKFLREAA